MPIEHRTSPWTCRFVVAPLAGIAVFALAVCGLAVPSVAAAPIQVTTPDPTSTADCTLADAVSTGLTGASVGACVWSGDAIVALEAATTYRLGAPLPPITADLEISGSDFAVSLPRIEHDAGSSGRFFDVVAPARLGLVRATLAGGSSDRGGAVRVQAGASLDVHEVVFEQNQATIEGGALWTAGTTTVVDSTFDGNDAVFGGALWNGGGSTASVTISRSLLVANTATLGAGVYQHGAPLAIEVSTLSANRASNYGGAIFLKSGTVTIEDSTLRNNRADDGIGGAVFAEWGQLSSVRSAWTADPVHGSLCFGGWYLSSGGDNAWSDGSCGTPAPSDVVVGAEIALSELVDHGGRTRVHVPLCDWTTGVCESPLLDRVSCCALGECPVGVWPARDQRNQFPRRDVIGGAAAASGGDLCDIGAYESVCESYSVAQGQGAQGTGERVTVFLHEQQIVTSERPILLDNGSCFTHPTFDGAGSDCRVKWQIYGATLAIRDVVFIEADCPLDCFHDAEACRASCATADPVGWVPDQDFEDGTFAFDVPSCNQPTVTGRYLAILEDTLDPGTTWAVDPQTPIDVDDGS